MRALIPIILILGLAIGVPAFIFLSEVRQIRSDDPRPRAIRRNHAEMARILQRLDAEHEAGLTYLDTDNHQEIQRALNKYHEEQ